MTNELAMAILASIYEQQDWYTLEDQFKQEGYDNDALTLSVDGVTVDMIDRAINVIFPESKRLMELKFVAHVETGAISYQDFPLLRGGIKITVVDDLVEITCYRPHFYNIIQYDELFPVLDTLLTLRVAFINCSH